MNGSRPSVVAVSASPSALSRSAAAAQFVLELLGGQWMDVHHLQVRDLPASDLLAADRSGPAIGDALARIHAADGIVITTPIHKASYSGLLKCLLDLLPQDELAGKVVLPVAIGGSLAHLLALDYALRPVLAALAARQVTAGAFLLDSAFDLPAGVPGPILLEDARGRLRTATAQFAEQLPRPAGANGRRIRDVRQHADRSGARTPVTAL
jgi:FMN reductase